MSKTKNVPSSSFLPTHSFKPFSIKLLQEIKLNFTPQVWALIFSFLPSEDIYFGAGCVCRKWKAQFMDPLILSGILQSEPAADSSSMASSEKKKNQSSEWPQQQFLRKRQFIERYKLLVRNYLLNDLAQLLRYSSDHAAFEVLINDESGNDAIMSTHNFLKQRTLDIQKLDALSTKVRSSLIKSVIGDDRSSTSGDLFGGVSVKPVTTSTSFTLTIDETSDNEEKTSLLHSYKRVRVSSFEIQEPIVNDLLNTRWNHYFSRFVWNRTSPISHVSDVHDDISQSENNASGFGRVIQSIMNMFGCSMENDLALSARFSLIQSSLENSQQDKNFALVKISLFINGEFGSFISEGYNEVVS